MHRSCNDGVIQLSSLSSYVVLKVVEISHTCFVHLVLQYSPHTCQLDPANLKATVEAEWILSFLFSRKWHFSITSPLHSVVHILMGHFTIFQSHGLSGWFVQKKTVKSCLNLSKLRPKYHRSLFLQTQCGIYCHLTVFIIIGFVSAIE